MPTNDIAIVPWQQEIYQRLPIVLGNIDYSEFEKTIKRINSILVKSDVEAMYMREYVKKYIDMLYCQSSGFPHPELQKSDVFLLFLRNKVENHFIFSIETRIGK